ncbi:MAG: hypothetical protein M1838_005576 [Thelocarpon superellum]|nr:MAG: hypothetical protein M1838_005576 [Thelocarpon superellum]
MAVADRGSSLTFSAQDDQHGHDDPGKEELVVNSHAETAVGASGSEVVLQPQKVQATRNLTPGESGAGEDRVLDTPAMENRYKNARSASDHIQGITKEARNDTTKPPPNSVRRGRPLGRTRKTENDKHEKTVAVLNDGGAVIALPPDAASVPDTAHDTDARSSTEQPAAEDVEPPEPHLTPTTKSISKRKLPIPADTAARPLTAKRRRNGGHELVTTAVRPTIASSMSPPGTDYTDSSIKDTQWTFQAGSSVPSQSSTQTPRKGPLAVSKDKRTSAQSPSLGVVFSNTAAPNQPKIKAFLKAQQIAVVHSVLSDEATMLCIGAGELRRTSKLTMSVALGKTIVTDEWLKDSAKAGSILDATPYLPRDPKQEEAWNFRLADAVERGRRGEGIRPLSNWAVVITPRLKADLGKSSELMDLVSFAGAASITHDVPSDPPEEVPRTLLLGSARDEGEVDIVRALAAGWAVYSTDIVSLSLLRGALQTGGTEFRIQYGAKKAPESVNGGRSRDRRRKAGS